MTGVTWKELVNSGVASDPDVVVGEMAARRGCRGGLLRVSLENAAPMVVEVSGSIPACAY